VASPQILNAAPNPPAPRLSIVVLPFANLSNDPDQEYFADGITDDLTTDLPHISDSFVIARTTAFTYKGKPVDVKQIGRELSVCYVLEGSVRRAGEQVQLNVQLIDAESGAHVWADGSKPTEPILRRRKTRSSAGSRGHCAWRYSRQLPAGSSRKSQQIQMRATT